MFEEHGEKTPMKIKKTGSQPVDYGPEQEGKNCAKEKRKESKG